MPSITIALILSLILLYFVYGGETVADHIGIHCIIYSVYVFSMFFQTYTLHNIHIVLKCVDITDDVIYFYSMYIHTKNWIWRKLFTLLT